MRRVGDVAAVAADRGVVLDAAVKGMGIDRVLVRRGVHAVFRNVLG